MMFGSSVRADIIKKQPSLPVTEISKVIGEMWRKLSEKDKTEWKKKADAQTKKNAKEFEKKSK